MFADILKDVPEKMNEEMKRDKKALISDRENFIVVEQA
jgi:hypothetical protein